MKDSRMLVFKPTFIIALLLFSLTNTTKLPAEENQLKDMLKRVIPATVLVVTYDEKGQPLKQGSGFFDEKPFEVNEVLLNFLATL